MIEIEKISNNFRTYYEIYESVKQGDFSVISRKAGTNEYPEIEWMISYFKDLEEYEKCHFLSVLQLPKVSQELIDEEVKKLKELYGRERKG